MREQSAGEVAKVIATSLFERKTMVRYALISDIHGNYKALEAFLNYIEEQSIDGIICLGDYVTDSPYPQKPWRCCMPCGKIYLLYAARKQGGVSVG